jgi:polyisoprenyl-phosphate glycosyltransferase
MDGLKTVDGGGPTRHAADPARASGPRTLSVVIPVFNEERGLARLLERLVPVLEATAGPFEVIFVDDGSTDATLAQVRAANAVDPRIKAIALSRNFGKEIAVTAGLRAARSEATVLMDADLQHPPELIPQLIAGWRDGHDIVYGARRDRDADSPLRRAFSGIYYKLFRALSGTRLHENGGDFRLFSRRALDAFNRLGERARFNKGLFAWIGYSVLAVPFEVPERADSGGSKWSLRKLTRFAIDGVASFSTLPLRVWSILGLAVSLFAFGYAVFFLIKTLIYGSDLAGFPSLIISIMFFGGVQLISLGVMGEYLGRIYDEVKGRPLYLVADEIGMAAHAGQGSTPPADRGLPHG